QNFAGQPPPLPFCKIGVLHWQGRQRAGLPLTESGIQGYQFLEEYTDGPSIGNNMVHCDQEHMIVFAEVNQRCAKHWPMLQIESLSGFGLRCLTDLFLLLFSWNMAEIERGELEFECWKNFLKRFSMPHDKTGSQDIVPSQNFVKTLFQGCCVQ